MLQHLFLLVLLTPLASATIAQTVSAGIRKEAITIGDMHALTWDMGTHYQLEDTAKAHKVIAADMAKFESHLKVISESAVGPSKTAVFIVGKIWEAYKRTLAAPQTPTNVKLIAAQTSQLMSACEYARSTFDNEGLTAGN